MFIPLEGRKGKKGGREEGRKGGGKEGGREKGGQEEGEEGEGRRGRRGKGRREDKRRGKRGKGGREDKRRVQSFVVQQCDWAGRSGVLASFHGAAGTNDVALAKPFDVHGAVVRGYRGVLRFDPIRCHLH